jgi:sulfonate transport system permease protein
MSLSVARGPRFDPRGLALPAALVGAWALLSATGHTNPRLLVPPQLFVGTALQSLTGADFWSAVGTSLARLAAGFALGALAGIAVGLLIGSSRLGERIAAPTFNGVRQVALFAWIPLLTAWFGDGEIAKILLIALAAFFPTVLNTEVGCRQVPRSLLEVGQVLEFDRWTTLRRIVIPGALRSITTGLQIALATAWIGTIGAEYIIDQGQGLGIALSSARIDNRMDLVLVDMIALALIGLGLNLLLRLALRRRSIRSTVIDD